MTQRRQTTLGECVRLMSGGTPSMAKEEYWNGSIPWVSCKDMKTLRLTDTEDHLSQTGVANGTKVVPAGTVLIVVRGMILAKAFPVAVTGCDMAFNQDLKAIMPEASITSQFLLYWLLAYTHDIMGIADEAAHGTKRIQTDRFMALPIYLPPLPLQKKIAAILSSYDDLIENNERRIKILENMAQNLYREWFVNFRFPGHSKVKMVDSPLGKIPKGWKVGRLDDAIVLQRGFDLPKQQRQKGHVPIYASTGITGYHGEAKVKGPGIVTGRSGSLGTVMYVEKDFWPLNTTLWVKQFLRASPMFALYLLRDLGLEQFNSGAAVPTLNRNDIHGLQVVLPSESVLSAFDAHVLTLFSQSRCLRQKNLSLRRTRDLLLPKLISGEVDVSKLKILTEGFTDGRA